MIRIAAANATAQEKAGAGPYVCLGDGTDWTVVRQALIDLPSTGGTLLLSSGTFDFGPSNVKIEHFHNVWIVGQGIDVTFVQNAPPNTADLEPFSYSDADGAVVTDMTLRSEPNGRLTSDVLDFDNSDNVRVERVKITASPARGIIFDGKDQAGQPGWQSVNNVVRNCEITGCTLSGIELLCAERCQIIDCTAYGNGEHGVNISAQNGTLRHSIGNTISGGAFRNNGLYGIAVSAGESNSVNGVTCSGNNSHGLAISPYGSTGRKSIGNSVTGGTFSGNAGHGIYILESDNNSVASARCVDNILDGVRVQVRSSTVNTAVGNRIENSVCTNSSSPGTQDWGVDLSGSDPARISETVIRNNDLCGNLRGALNNKATNTTTSGNLCFDDGTTGGTITPTSTHTPTPTNTPTSTPTNTPTSTPTNTPTNTPTVAPQDPEIVLDKIKSKYNGVVRAQISGFASSHQVTLKWPDGRVLAQVQTDGDGNATASFRTPLVPYGTYTVRASDMAGHSASDTLRVIPRVLLAPDSSGPGGTVVRIYYYGYVPGNRVEAWFYTETTHEVLGSAVTIAENGRGTRLITIPEDASLGEHVIRGKVIGLSRSASARFTVTASAGAAIDGTETPTPTPTPTETPTQTPEPPEGSSPIPDDTGTPVSQSPTEVSTPEPTVTPEFTPIATPTETSVPAASPAGS